MYVSRIQGPHVRSDHRDTRMEGCGFEEERYPVKISVEKSTQWTFFNLVLLVITYSIYLHAWVLEEHKTSTFTSVGAPLCTW